MADNKDEYYQPWLRDPAPTPSAGRADEGLAKPREEPPLGIDIARYDRAEKQSPSPPVHKAEVKRTAEGFGHAVRKSFDAFAEWTIELGERADIPARVEAMEIPRRTREALQSGIRLSGAGARALGRGSARAGRAAARTGGQVWTSMALGRHARKLSDEAGRGIGAVAGKTKAGLETVAGAAKESVGEAAKKLRPPPAADTPPPPSGLEQLLAREEAEAVPARKAAPDLPLFAGEAIAPAETRPKPAARAETDDRTPLAASKADAKDRTRGEPGAQKVDAAFNLSARQAMIAGGAAIVLLGAAFWLGGRTSGGLDKQEVEAVVADYIRANPQLIPEAIEAQREAEVAKAVEGIRPALEKPYAGAWAGNADGDVTLVVFTDYACGFCRASVPDIDRLLREDRRLKVVFRELPIIAPQSRDAALMALAAARQGKYDAFHHAMFAAPSLEPQAIAAAAERAGVVTDGSADATANEALFQRELDNNLAIATQLQLNATPTWVIGNRILQGQIGYDALREAIARARSES